MWPNKTPTHPCHSFTDSHRGSIKPLLHSNFERYSCPTLKYPTLFKNWKIEGIRNSFNFHMPSSIPLNSCNMNQHLLLLLSSHFTLFPIAKGGRGEQCFPRPTRSSILWCYSGNVSYITIFGLLLWQLFPPRHCHPQYPTSLLELQTFSTDLKTCQ